MKNNFYLLAVALIVVFSSCCNQNENKEQDGKHEMAVAPTSSTGNFGEDITADNAIEAVKLPELLEGKETVEVKLTGDVAAVCQMSGCWMDVAMGDGEIIHVTLKDDSFLLPKDAAGKKAVLEGVATYEEIPVDMLKHMAEDEGRTQEEIDAITEPKLEYTFIAKGVILY
jgi:hypothetical protein